MKTALTILLSFLSAMLFAQDISEVIESEYPFTSGTKHVYQVEVTNATIDQFKDAINDGLKIHKSKLKAVKGADDEYYIDPVVIPDISHKQITGFWKLQQLSNGARMMVHFMAEGEAVTSESEGNLYENAMAYPDRIGGRVSAKVLAISIEDEIKKLEDLNKELEGLNKNLADIDGDILEANNAILAAETGIETNATKVEGLNTEIGAKQEEISGIQMELASVDVKGYESQIKDHEKAIEGYHKEISKINEEIAKSKASQAGLESELEMLEAEIEAKTELMAVDPKVAKDVKSLNKDKIKLNEEIMAAVAEQGSLESQIEMKQTMIESENDAITEIKTLLNSHNEDALEGQIKELEKIAKDLEKQKEAVAKDSEKKQEEIYGAKANVAELEMEKTQAQAAIEAKKEEIAEQESLIAEIQARIDQYK